MPSQNTPNQYHLIGEYVPMWFVIGLMMLGVVGSIITAELLLTPESDMEILSPSATQSNDKEHHPIPPSPVIETTEIPMASTPQNPTAEQVEPIPEALQSEPESQEKDPEVKPEVSTSASTDIPDQPLTTAQFEQEVSVVDVAPIIVERNDARKSVSLSTDTTTASTPQAQIESDTDEARDCPPLFTVSFNHGSVDPKDLDLDVKATRLGEWLNLHPETIILIEGYTDATGPEELNILISHRRAKAVFEQLASAGIAKNQMATRALGEHALLTELPDPSGKNRRVSLRVEGAAACLESTEDGKVR